MLRFKYAINHTFIVLYTFYFKNPVKYAKLTYIIDQPTIYTTQVVNKIVHSSELNIDITKFIV